MSKGNAIHCHGEQPELISAWGKTATEAFLRLGLLVDEFIENDYLLQGVNVYVEDGLVNLTATVSTVK